HFSFCFPILQCYFFLVMNPSTLLFTLFPYTTLFRSRLRCKPLTHSYTMYNGSWVWLTAGKHFSVAEANLMSIPEKFPPKKKNLRSEEHTSELQSRENLVCSLLLEKKKTHQVKRIEIY